MLSTIMSERVADAAVGRLHRPLRDLAAAARDRVHHSLRDALAAGGAPIRIIAETKQASPSAGLLQPEYDPAANARAYAEGGACGISVLTEPRHFLGRVEDLEAVRAAVDLPVLRKDFVGDVYQIAEAAAWGADAVLLIVAALERALLRDLHAAARHYGLDVLAEAHTVEEVEVALALDGAIVGVNSRNLRTLRTDLRVAEELGRAIPPDRLAVAESGIRTRAEILRLSACGYRGFLIGETLLRGGHPAENLRELLMA